MNAKIPASTNAIVTIANSTAVNAKAMEMLVGQSIPQRLGYGGRIGVGDGTTHQFRPHLCSEGKINR
jgi:hypothetical protein